MAAKNEAPAWANQFDAFIEGYRLVDASSPDRTIKIGASQDEATGKLIRATQNGRYVFNAEISFEVWSDEPIREIREWMANIAQWLQSLGSAGFVEPLPPDQIL